MNANLSNAARASKLVLGVSVAVVLFLLIARNLKIRTKSAKQLHFGGATRDLIDQASWESFPASDSPGW